MQCYGGTDSCATVVPIRRYCQFMGTLKVYQNDEKVEINKVLNDTMGDDADDISKFIEDWKYYPVLKLQIVGRIF